MSDQTPESLLPADDLPTVPTPTVPTPTVPTPTVPLPPVGTVGATAFAAGSMPPPPPPSSAPQPAPFPVAGTDVHQPAAARPRRGRLVAAVAATALIASSAGAAAGVLLTRDDNKNSTATSTAVNTSSSGSSSAITPLSTQTGTVLDTPTIVAKTTPSVVSIRVTTTGTDIFQQQVTQEGVGTGFIASADGLIYTNAHVVADATEVEVTLGDGSTKKGTVVGTDTTDDLAVVKVDASGLTPLPLGKSSALRVGDPVVAVGNALALTGGPTATQGIVSALNRTIDTNNGEHLARLLQTDAAINPGNSGGPLLNAFGEVVGINTAGATNAENVGFAIALDTAKPILEELAQGKSHLKAFLGVQTKDVTPEFASQESLSVDQGAYVAAVTSGSGADAAGVQKGDVITKIDSTDITSSTDVGVALSTHQPGDKVTVTVRRGDNDVTLTATLGSRKA